MEKISKEELQFMRRAFRNVLVEWRAERNLSQNHVAHHCSLSNQQVYRLENAQESPTLTSLASIITGLEKNWFEFGMTMERAVQREQELENHKAEKERIIAERIAAWAALRQKRIYLQNTARKNWL